MILTNDKEIVYKNEPWKCRISKHAKAFVNICKKTNTIVYSCTTCLILDEKPVKHLYIYPHEKVKDYDPFYACPMKEQANSIPTIHHSLTCIKCNENKFNCPMIGLVWFCYKCEKEQLKLFTSPASYIHIGKRTNKPVVTSGVCWICKRCHSMKLYYFNDSLRINHSLIFTYCNL